MNYSSKTETDKGFSNYLRLAEKFQNREVVINTMMTMFRDPLILEAMNCDELDYILFDGEHGVFNPENLVPLLQVCRLIKLPAIVRVADCEYHLIARMMDLGADGIMVPRVESLSQLRTAVDAIFFFPDGRTGDGGHGQFRPGEVFGDFKKTRYLLPQIESPKGVTLLPQMLDEYGEYISAVIIGPSDLSIMMGHPRQIQHPEVLAAIQKVFDVCNTYGKSCGIYCDNESLARQFRDMGCNVLWVSGDKGHFMRGYQAQMEILKKIK